MNGKTKNYIKLALFFIVLFLLFLVVGAVLQSLSADETVQAFVTLLNSLVFSGITLAVYKRFFGETTGWYKNAHGIIVTVFFSCAVILFLNWFYSFHGFADFAANWLFCLLFAAAAGIAEEVMFRGFLFDYICKKSSLVAALVVTSVIFGSLHLLNFFSGQEIQFLYILNCICAGVFMSFLYYEYGIICSLLFHISWNAIFSENAIEAKPLTGIILLAAGIVIFAVEEKLKRKR